MSTQKTTIEQTNPSPLSKYRPKYIPIQDIIEYLRKGLTQAEVARLYGVHPSSISAMMSRHRVSLQSLDTLKKHRADVFASISARILNSITEKDITSATLLQKLTAIGIIYDKERLERGKSTANISVKDTLQVVQEKLREITAEEEKLRKDMQERGGRGRSGKV